MEATVGAEAQLFYGANTGNFRGLGDRTLEWDPNRWKWDGDLFIATPINLDSGPSNYQSKQFFPLENRIHLAGAASNSSSSCSDELSLEAGKDRREVERKRRVVTDDDDERNVEAGSLTLNLGGNGNPTIGREQIDGDGTSGKKAKIGGVTSSRAVCQVDGCKIDLSKAKDYHRRHKVCETHSKASEALVGNVMQRFCQQCSRFHALQEFDEGKRSCRRRLAGHNKRRRKTQPDSTSNNMNSVNNNQANGYLLMSLLKILSNLHSSRASGANDENLLSHLLRSLAAQGSLDGDKNLSQLIQSANSPAGTKSSTGQAVHSNGHQIPPRPKPQNSSVVAAEMPQRVSHAHNAIFENLHMSSQKPGKIIPTGVSSLTCEVGNGSAERTKLNNFDLNDVYIDSDDGIEDAERFPVSTEIGTGSPGYPSWMQQDSLQSSPPQTSGTSGSASAQSPSSSNGEAQSRTDRIVFKLFGRDPNDFPLVLKAQILDWLAHSPTDIESYIRPGCIILTLFLRLPESKWEELSCDLRSSLNKLLDISYDDVFWTNGWIYTRVQNRIAFAHNGRIVMDTSLSFRRNEHSTILSIKPIAVPVSETTRFFIKGTNLSRTSTSFLCALEGQYLTVEANYESKDPEENVEHDEIQCLKLSCSLPAFSGRGFIEVEDHGLSSSFFPFIVAEKDICSEISSLESVIDIKKIDNVHDDINKIESRNQALDFIHEMGWLLHRNNLRSKLNHLDPTSDLFPFRRYKWLMEFAVEHEWCAVVCKLLDVLLKGRIGGGDYPFLKYALSELGLLHRAVRRNSKSLVELLQRYTPQGVAEELSLECKSLVGDGGFLFRPDFRGPGGLTPLHVAAGRDGSEDVLDVLTNDPGEVGIEAWKNSRDSTGSTPEDYARLRGHFSYIHLVQRKINKRAPTGHVVVDVPVTTSERIINIKQDEVASTAFEIAGAQLRAMQRPCGLCDQKVAFGYNRRSLLYRPAMLSMVAIAAVCVCVALLFKSSPEVLYVFRPFRWETLEYGTS